MATETHTHTTPAFVDVWNPEQDPHLEITGQTGAGKTVAVQRIAEHAIAHHGAEVSVVAGARLAPGIRAVGGIAIDTDTAHELVERTLRTLNRRLAELEADRLNGDPAPTYGPLLLVVDEYATLLQRSSQKTVLQRQIGDYIGDLIALGATANIHVAVTGPKPCFASSGIAQIVLGPLTDTTAERLSAGGYTEGRVRELPPLPRGAGWYFRTNGRRDPVWF